MTNPSERKGIQGRWGIWFGVESEIFPEKRAGAARFQACRSVKPAPPVLDEHGGMGRRITEGPSQ